VQQAEKHRIHAVKRFPTPRGQETLTAESESSSNITPAPWPTPWAPVVITGEHEDVGMMISVGGMDTIVGSKITPFNPQTGPRDPNHRSDVRPKAEAAACGGRAQPDDGRPPVTRRPPRATTRKSCDHQRRIKRLPDARGRYGGSFQTEGGHSPLITVRTKPRLSEA